MYGGKKDLDWNRPNTTQDIEQKISLGVKSNNFKTTQFEFIKTNHA